MDDETLSARLAASAPPIAPRGGRFAAALEEAMTSSRPAQRRRKRWLLGGVTASVVLLGGTTAAFASEPLLEWLGFVPDQSLSHTNAEGDFCVAGMVVHPEGVPKDDASFLAAKRILLSIDFDTLEIPASIRDGYAYSDEAAAVRAASIAEYNAAHPESTFQPAPPDPESSMLIDTAYQVIAAGVSAEGLDANHFWLEAGGTCAEDVR